MRNRWGLFFNKIIKNSVFCLFCLDNQITFIYLWQELNMKTITNNTWWWNNLRQSS